MLKDIIRQRNVIFNVVQTLNDEYKKANLNAHYSIGKTEIILTINSNKKNIISTTFDTSRINTYQELYKKVYNTARYGIIQRLSAI